MAFDLGVINDVIKIFEKPESVENKGFVRCNSLLPVLRVGGSSPFRRANLYAPKFGVLLDFGVFLLLGE